VAHPGTGEQIEEILGRRDGRAVQPEDDVANEHARLSGFPATRITEVCNVIGPMTAVAG